MAGSSKGGALVPKSGGEDDNAELDTALRGVEGKVRKNIVIKLRKLVEQDPEKFVRGMRVWLDQGRAEYD